MTVLNSQKNPSGARGLFDFTQGIEADRKIAPFEVQVQKAWVAALERVHVLSPAEAGSARGALEEALAQIQSDSFEWRVEDEDIHMNLERFLTDRIGETGKRIHLGRSRNDLIATSLRLYVDHSLRSSAKGISSLVLALVGLAETNTDILVPGMTHLQNGQPIRLGHIFAAHGWAFIRDAGRFEQAAKSCMSSLPLGSAALAGTTLPLDLGALARELGFESPNWNSYDSVGDRDFMLEGLHAMSIAAIHLSRLSEDLIYWASTPVGLVRLPPKWSTGSSIMPNKRNPDVPELIRARSAHILAAANNAHLVTKALPTSYASDLHELKGVYQRAEQELNTCVEVLTAFLSELRVHSMRAKELLNQGHLLSTDVANHLTSKKIPFREAYRQTAALVQAAECNGVSIEGLDSEKAKAASMELDSVFLKKLSFESSVEARSSQGGTSLEQTKMGIQALKSKALRYAKGEN